MGITRRHFHTTSRDTTDCDAGQVVGHSVLAAHSALHPHYLAALSGESMAKRRYPRALPASAADLGTGEASALRQMQGRAAEPSVSDQDLLP